MKAILAACIAATLLSTGDVQAAGQVCTSEYYPYTTTPVCYGANSYDWRSIWTSVKVENHTGANILVTEYSYDEAARTSTVVYPYTTLPNNQAVQWQSPRTEGKIGVYVWCAAAYPKINADGDGYCGFGP